MWIKIKEHNLGNKEQLLVGDKIKQLKGRGNQNAMGFCGPQAGSHTRETWSLEDPAAGCD
jgi:hypothetical protein